MYPFLKVRIYTGLNADYITRAFYAFYVVIYSDIVNVCNYTPFITFYSALALFLRGYYTLKRADLLNAVHSALLPVMVNTVNNTAVYALTRVI